MCNCAALPSNPPPGRAGERGAITEFERGLVLERGYGGADGTQTEDSDDNPVG